MYKWIKTAVYYNGTTAPTAEAEIDCRPDHNSYIEILSDGSYTIGENKKLFYASMLMRCKMNLVERGIYTLESINKNSHIIALDRLKYIGIHGMTRFILQEKFLNIL